MAARRSQRATSSRGTLTRGEAWDPTPSEVDEGSENDEDIPRRKKSRAGVKRKTAGTNARSDAGQPSAPKRVRGNRGLLKNVVDMPLDIVFEIFGKLSPGDLLNLAQTSKDLRHILMSRSSASVWKEARQNHPDLPTCPADLSEPQYADLCFGKRCTNCTRHRIIVTHTVWAARVRLCKDCLTETCAIDYPLNWRISGNNRAFAWLPCVSIKRAGRYNFYDKYYHKETVDKWVEQTASLQPGDDALVALLDDLEEKFKHGKLCEAWAEKRKLELLDKRTDSIDHNRDLIVEHAKSLGWDEEFALSSHALVAIKESDIIRRACGKNITPKVLANLEETIETVLQEAREKRILDAAETLLRKRLPIYEEVFQECVKTLSPAEPVPTPRQIFDIPRVRNLIANTPETIDMTADDLKSVVRDDFAALVDEWRTGTEAAMVDVVKTSYGPDRIIDEETVLQLASTVFICRNCVANPIEFMDYRRAMSHVCNVALYNHLPLPLSPHEKVQDTVLRSVLREAKPGHNKTFTVNADVSKLLGDIIELCGFDQHTTTRTEMDAVNPIIECLSCHSEVEGRAVMSWWNVLNHWGQKHSQKYRYGYDYESRETMNLRVVTDPREAEGIRSELALQREKDAARFKTSACAECHFKETSTQLIKHWKLEHGRRAGDGDILPHIDSEPGSGVYYSWPPRYFEDHDLLKASGGIEITVKKGWASPPDPPAAAT